MMSHHFLILKIKVVRPTAESRQQKQVQKKSFSARQEEISKEEWKKLNIHQGQVLFNFLDLKLQG